MEVTLYNDSIKLVFDVIEETPVNFRSFAVDQNGEEYGELSPKITRAIVNANMKRILKRVAQWQKLPF